MAERKPNTLASSDDLPEVDISVELPARTPPVTPSFAQADDPPSAIPSPGALIDSKYRVERLIARGGMGAVYAATHMVSGKKVALKWMLPALGQIKGARERFLQEACATARIAHPNIVDIYDVGSEQGAAYLVMEYLRGETLADRMCRQRLSVTDAVALLMPALRGVAAAHAHGVIHRDLKPENIFLCCTEHGEELEPKVLDFGISKITTDQVQSLALTHSGAVLGTPYYMSPEQVRGSRDVDARADVYSLGVILFEALTGERPFEAETYNELILKIATAPMPNAAALNPALDARLISIVERAMARDPLQRFAEVKELALALEPFGGGVRFRTMHTLNNHRPVSGDYAIPAVEPTRADTAPASVPPSASEPVPVATHPQRGTRLAVFAAFASLLTCAGVALYFINGPVASNANANEPGPSNTANGQSDALRAAHLAPEPGTHTRTDDKNAATSADALSRQAAEEGKSPEYLAPGVTPGAGHPVARAVQPIGAGPQTKKAPASGSAKRGLHPSRAALAAPQTDGQPTPPTAAPLVVRALPSDWERRLDEHTAAPANVHMPAGSMNMNDFR